MAKNTLNMVHININWLYCTWFCICSDFVHFSGLAVIHRTDRAENKVDIRKNNNRVGTKRYMAPEVKLKLVYL